MNDYNHIAEVEDWKKLTMMSGRLNPKQMENIKALPWTIIEGKRPIDLTIAVDFDLKINYKDKEGHQKPGYVCYNLMSENEVFVNDDMLEMVAKSLQTLFWDNLMVIFQYNGDIFWSNRHEGRKQAAGHDGGQKSDGDGGEADRPDSQ